MPGPRFQIYDDLEGILWNSASEIQPAVNILVVNSGKHFIHQELFAVHRSGTSVCRVTRRAHPLEVTHHIARNFGMDLCALRSEKRPRHSTDNGLGKVI